MDVREEKMEGRFIQWPVLILRKVFQHCLSHVQRRFLLNFTLNYVTLLKCFGNFTLALIKKVNIFIVDLIFYI